MAVYLCPVMPRDMGYKVNCLKKANRFVETLMRHVPPCSFTQSTDGTVFVTGGRE